ncbi:acetyl-CoA carboxylase biotin carboxylase subunit family protein [Streptacidiphilus sp. N1-3]|uniref:Acetyl-CoA carboxylase biotin carboxylase subunit family protein n=1 Tax=Streptacidiphilus alkalitolerans TaxID=3342712 RepID=A0ABV6WTQ7_9ACTN
MNDTALSADPARAFILTGSFLVVGRFPQYLRELSERGLTILLITGETWREQAQAALKDPEHPASVIAEVAFVDGAVGHEGSFVAGAVAAASGWRQRYDIVGAFAVGETMVEPTGLLADALGLAGPGLRASRACRDKALQRWYLPQFSPASLVLPAGQRHTVALDQVTFPAVVKPVGRHSSSGVAMVEDQQALRRQLETYPDYETVLVEAKVVGQEFSVESLLQDGEVVFSSATRKDTNDSHTCSFVELAHTIPNDRTEVTATLLAANAEALRGLDFRDGIAHAEWRIDAEGRPFLMEVAARPAGDGISALYHLTHGRPLEPEVVRIALREPAGYPAARRIGRQVYLEHDAGVFDGVTVDWPGVEPVWAEEGEVWPEVLPGAADEPAALRSVMVLKPIGTELGPLRSSEDRVLSFLIDAPTAAELDAVEQRVRAAITLHVSPATGGEA